MCVSAASVDVESELQRMVLEHREADTNGGALTEPEEADYIFKNEAMRPHEWLADRGRTLVDAYEACSMLWAPKFRLDNGRNAPARTRIN